MIDITKIAKAVAKQASNIEAELVPGAIAWSWKGEKVAFFGVPVQEMFPTQFEKIRAFIRRGVDEAAEESWAEITGSHLAPGRSEAKIQGLADRGMSCAMRKKTTRFGSGWQGLEEGFSVKFEDVAGMNMLKLMKGEQEAGFLLYTMQKGGIAKIESTEIFQGFRGQGLGRSLYREAGFHAKAKGALYFRSDIEGKVSAPAQKAWKAGMEEMPGVIETIAGESGTFMMKLTRLTSKVSKNVMKTGEGGAISQAGVAEIPSIVRAGARIMKNAL